jgi:tetratricopeptide (TPR) repeat protein
MIKGNQAFKEQQWQKAISYYNEAIKLNDKNATYYSNRAAAYLELGRYCFILECCCIGILLYLADKFLFLSVSIKLKQIVQRLSTLIKR